MDPRADDAVRHRQAWDAIPWVVNGSASEAQRLRVQRHVDACADCRDELARQRAMQAAMTREQAPATDVEAGLQRLWARVDSAEDEAAAVPAAVAGRASQRPRLLLAALATAVVVEAVALSVLGIGLLSRDEGSGGYRTLADAAAPDAGKAAIRIVAGPQMSLGDLQRVLLDLELEIVAGPNQAGAYALAPRAGRVASAALDEQVVRLRATPGLLLVEPVGR